MMLFRATRCSVFSILTFLLAKMQASEIMQ